MAQDLLGRQVAGDLSGAYYALALEEAVESASFGRLLHHRATVEIAACARKTRKAIEEFLDLEDLDASALDARALEEQIRTARHDWGSTSAEEFWQLLGGAFSLSAAQKKQTAASAGELQVSEIEALVDTLRRGEGVLDERVGLQRGCEALHQGLRDGLILAGITESGSRRPRPC